MTGVFIVKLNGKVKMHIEQPFELSDFLPDWWYKAEHGDRLEIYCELPD